MWTGRVHSRVPNLALTSEGEWSGPKVENFQIPRYCDGFLSRSGDTRPIQRSGRNFGQDEYTTDALLHVNIWPWSAKGNGYRSPQSSQIKISSKSRFSAAFRHPKWTISSRLLPSRHLPSPLILNRSYLYGCICNYTNRNHRLIHLFSQILFVRGLRHYWEEESPEYC